ncbi:hypothetical protein V6U78_10145 [Marinospirillum sp. MEB164]|uniref:DUF3311 domain-containing protein n=1 Tax=Marinospirillum alkalitolerans TaxID=3123374 RepID=A0ABW8PZZ2_9GAMM
MKAPARSARLISLTLLAVMLLTPPLLLLFDRPNTLGFSTLPVYLFTVWLLILLAAAWIMESPAHPPAPEKQTEKNPPSAKALATTQEPDDAS